MKRNYFIIKPSVDFIGRSAIWMQWFIVSFPKNLWIFEYQQNLKMEIYSKVFSKWMDGCYGKSKRKCLLVDKYGFERKWIHIMYIPFSSDNLRYVVCEFQGITGVFFFTFYDVVVTILSNLIVKGREIWICKICCVL